jgi:hypothetical protein
MARRLVEGGRGKSATSFPRLPSPAAPLAQLDGQPPPPPPKSPNQPLRSLVTSSLSQKCASQPPPTSPDPSRSLLPLPPLLPRQPSLPLLSLIDRSPSCPPSSLTDILRQPIARHPSATLLGRRTTPFHSLLRRSTTNTTLSTPTLLSILMPTLLILHKRTTTHQPLLKSTPPRLTTEDKITDTTLPLLLGTRAPTRRTVTLTKQEVEVLTRDSTLSLLPQSLPP